MTKFRFTGQVQFLGRTVPIDLWFDCSAMDLADALAGLVVYPDDPNWPVATIPELGDSLPTGQPASLPARTRPRIADPDLFDDLDQADDARKWQIVAEHHPWLFQDDPVEQAAASVTTLPSPPRSLKDIQKMQADGDDFEADLTELLQAPREELLKSDGTINASEVARRIGRRTGGSDWSYVQELSAHLQARFDEEDLAAADLSVDSAEEAA